MLMTELIAKKRDGEELTTEEIQFMIDGYVKGTIPDYQMSAMLMAIYFRGLNTRETVDLTLSMMNSGDTIDLSSIEGIKADKHSTGGVGDKTSLVLCPMVACCGVKMAKMSGRGLGHTGGTLDKMESIPGLTVDLTPEQFFSQVNRVGFAIAGQSANIDPADKKLYALRDVTGTVGNQGLIVSSIMSKKLAAGADIICLDVKCGSGAFMKTEEDARSLASAMVEIGNAAGRKTMAVITDMDRPLGSAVGNALEVKEAIACLKGEYEGDLLELCLQIGSLILMAADKAKDMAEARELLLGTIKSGAALNKLADFVEAQGGDRNAVFDTSILPAAPVVVDVIARKDGYVSGMHADGVGEVSLHLGGGRATKEDIIDPAVGLIIHRKTGDFVKKGEAIATIHASSVEKAAEADVLLRNCYTFSDTAPTDSSFIKGIVR